MALERCQELLTRSCSSPEQLELHTATWPHAGFCLLALRRFPPALEAFEAASRQNAGLNGGLGAELQLELFLGEGWSALGLEKPGRARQCFSDALEVLKQPSLLTPLRFASAMAGQGEALRNLDPSYLAADCFRHVLERFGASREAPAHRALAPFIATALYSLAATYEMDFDCAPAALPLLRELEARFGSSTTCCFVRLEPPLNRGNVLDNRVLPEEAESALGEIFDRILEQAESTIEEAVKIDAGQFMPLYLTDLELSLDGRNRSYLTITADTEVVYP